ncbi:hypothetical protein PENARI_c002G00074 [Penicillium arizonense]|uniref:Uncharacterized protein n=1 Tax=Penicillium arizonense TaxID=1835702 RepID=A0A1F5LVY2_PENAI|nr:hypothetical protein PENARI_c002G00074 [Penicillium arizonense]OGE57313.1 hypothetical protein PENARI_c002G00074 [Penicillium arizonense]
MATNYIVTFQDSATTEQINTYIQQINGNGGTVINRFPDMVARGFVACIPDSVLEKLQSDPLIDNITPDSSS